MAIEPTQDASAAPANGFEDRGRHDIRRRRHRLAKFSREGRGSVIDHSDSRSSFDLAVILAVRTCRPVINGKRFRPSSVACIASRALLVQTIRCPTWARTGESNRSRWSGRPDPRRLRTGTTRDPANRSCWRPHPMLEHRVNHSDPRAQRCCISCVGSLA